MRQTAMIGDMPQGSTMSAMQTYFDQETRTEIIDYSMEVEGA